MKNKLLIFLLLHLCGAAFAQTTIKGRITSLKGEGLPGVSVVVKGTTAGVATDIEGNYQLRAPENGNTLVISYIGYVSQEIPLNGRTSIDITLQEDHKALDEVVVVGYGTQERATVTGAIETVSAQELKDIPVAQVTQKLQGKLAGVQIAQTTGKPGQGMTVRIRGQASISAGSQPLYVVDGFPIVGDISNINPNEIESISVLKDGASAALYGSRAANGVVLITTKRAKTGETNIGLSAYYGVQQVPQKGRPDMMNAREFAQFKKEVAEENGRPVDPAYQNPEQYGEGTDWYDALLRTAPIQDYTLSLTAGKDKFSTAVVAGYFSQDGVMKNSGYKRFSLRINSEFAASDKVKMGFNLAPTYAVNRTPQSDGVWWVNGSILQGALLTTPLAPYMNEDGSIPLTATGPGLFPNPNWYNVLQVVKNETQTSRMLSNGFVEYQPLNGLTLKTSINVDLKQSLYNNFTPSTTGSLFNPPPRIPTAIQSNDQFYSWLSENTAVYKKTFGDHDFDALVGYTVQKYKQDFTLTNASNFPDDKIQTLNGATNTLTVSDVQEWALISYLSRINYNYKGKYLLTAVLRRDGSSRFGSKNKWGNFPSISAGWIVSDEKFMPQSDVLTFLKVRGSYGALGNNNIGNYTQYAGVVSTNYAFNNALTGGRSVVSIGNENLGWEKTTQTNVGVDFGFLNNRITANYDYYTKNTSDLLYSLDVPYASGFSNYITNIGELKFWGHEIAINSKNLVGNFTWNTDFNVSINDNKVVALGTENAPLYGGVSITEVGKRVGQFYGMVWEGVYQNQQDLDSSPRHETSVVGSAKFKDVNGDGRITQDDRTAIGNPFPKYNFGITNSFGYKNFDLSIVASGVHGNVIANRMMSFTGNLDGVFNVTRDVMNRWRSPENPGNGLYGTTKAGSTALERDWFSSRFLSKGSYLTIRNITLGYNLPIDKMKAVRSVRIYGSVQQALVFTKYKGINPEANTNTDGTEANALNQGNDHGTYPVPRTMTVGLNVNF